RHEHHGGRAPLPRLEDLVAERRPAAGLLSVELGGAVPLLGLVAEHERDLSLEIDPRELPVVERRRFDAVSQERDLAREGARIGKAQRYPRGIRDAVQPVSRYGQDARLHVEALAVALPERRLEAVRAKAVLDPLRRLRDAGGAEPAALHAVVREGVHAGAELL